MTDPPPRLSLVLWENRISGGEGRGGVAAIKPALGSPRSLRFFDAGPGGNGTGRSFQESRESRRRGKREAGADKAI